jgi:uncharacterized protein (TIGR02171 family)
MQLVKNILVPPKLSYQAICFLAVYFLSCEHFESSTSAPEPDVPGMALIRASGKAILLGADDAVAGAEEKPVQQVSFTYDYRIDSTEVSRQEYEDVTGSLPTGDSSSGDARSLPVRFVTWFDAVLYCNAKSKLDGLDTVYVYSGPPIKESGAVVALTGITISYDRAGYRLPTEAEWEYAAREGKSALPFAHLSDSAAVQSYAWYSANAGNSVHPVAEKIPNAFGLYDMAGNVFEWTADWKQFYTGVPVVNSIGGRVPNSQYERAVKGGSYLHGAAYLRPSRRSATYPVSQSLALGHMGFRCARGIIPNPQYLTQTDSVATNRTILLTSSATDFVSAHGARVVFVNVSRNLATLCFIDFASAFPAIYEFKEFTATQAPAISPDGRHVAFSTVGEGMSSASETYVRSLDSLTQAPQLLPLANACLPRWWVNPASLDTFLIYTTSAADNTSAGWTSAKTMMVKMSGSQTAGTPATVCGNGAYHGGRSADGRYLFTGRSKLFVYDTAGGTSTQLFTAAFNGKGTDGSDQVCNVSASPSLASPARCLFLDFGAPRGSSITGGSYVIHEYLFISDVSGRVTWYCRAPQPEISWDFPEWSNADGYAIACCHNQVDDPHAVYLVDLEKKTSLKIVEGTFLRDPGLWIDRPSLPANPDSLSLDSLGWYNDPTGGYGQGQDYFANRMHFFWRKCSDMEIVFVGSSHTGYGIDPKSFSVPAYNMGFPECMLSTVLTVLNDYVMNHCPKLALVGMDILPGGLVGWGTADDYSWNQNIYNSKGYAYDRQHGFWRDGTPANLEALASTAPYPRIDFFDTLGMYHPAPSGWGGDPPDIQFAEYNSTWTTEDSRYLENFAMLRDAIVALNDRKVHCLLYLTPESPYYKNTPYYTRYGPTWEMGRQVVAQFKALADSLEYCHFYDAYNEGDHDYTDADAYDWDHLSASGARKFSARVDSVVKAILNR